MGEIRDLFEGKTFEPIEADPPARRKRMAPWDREESIALIAAKDGKGCILSHDGDGIEADIDSLGVGDLGDHGLDDAPDGLSIWEGRLDAWVSHSPENGTDYEAQLEGKFRDLTEREWFLLRNTGTPWEYVEDDARETNG